MEMPLMRKVGDRPVKCQINLQQTGQCFQVNIPHYSETSCEQSEQTATKTNQQPAANNLQ